MNDYVKKIQDELSGNLPFRIRDDLYTLIIGLGGSGVKFASETKELLSQRYGETEVTEKLDFLCLDTDATSRPVNMSDNEYLLIDGLHDDPWVEGWLNPDLLRRKQSKELRPDDPGAGGIRMLGRWRLFSSVPFVFEKLDSIIQKYSDRMGQKTVRKIFVIIMSSICGGTGCGIFIDIPYFVRKAIAEKGILESSVFYYGMLELPDSKIASSNMDAVDRERCKANSYAAMKDLEYYMRQDTEYFAKFTGKDFKTKARVFHQCFLLSNDAVEKNGQRYNRNAIDGSGTIYLPGAIPEAVNMMVCKNVRYDETLQQYIDWFVLEGEGSKKMENMMGFDSKMSNVNTQGFRHDTRDGKEQVISTFGVSKIEIPKAQIILAIFSRVFLGLKSRWELISDKKLLEKVIKREIPLIFEIEETYEALMGILMVRNIKDKQLSSPDFLYSLDAMINNLPKDDNYDKIIAGLHDRLEKKILEIYSTHGPFFTLKMFEIENYGSYLDFLLNKIRPEPYSINTLSDLLKDYLAFKPNCCRKKEKIKMNRKVLNAIEAYTKYKVYLFWEKQIAELKTKISRTYHNDLFMRVTKMVIAMREIFEGITNIKTYTSEVKTSESTIFSWNFSDVPYSQITEKVNFLFAKKIIWKKQGVPNPVETITKSKIYLVEKGMTNKDKELFYWPKTEGPIEVEYLDEEEGTKKLEIISIEEVMQIGTGAVVSIEGMIKKFLLQIAERKDLDIFTIILNSFREIIKVIDGIAFTDMIILSSSKIDMSQPLNAMNQQRKDYLFREAIEQFNKYALPSIPLYGQYVKDQFEQRNYSVSFEPEFEENYSDIIDKVQTGIIKSNEITRIPKQGLSIMIAINFYFDYAFYKYSHIGDCKTEYDKIKDTNMGIGLHIAEGSKEDIRLNLIELV